DLPAPLAVAMRERRDLLPELLGDERDQRVRQPQARLEDLEQGAPRGALASLARIGELDLGGFDVPVAVLVPDELVDRPGNEVEAVVGIVALDLGGHPGEARRDPAIERGEIEMAVGRIPRPEPAIASLAVHEHEAGGVPELVAEVAVALAAV